MLCVYTGSFLFLSPQELQWRSSSGSGAVAETCSQCQLLPRWPRFPSSHTWTTKYEIFNVSPLRPNPSSIMLLLAWCWSCYFLGFCLTCAREGWVFVEANGSVYECVKVPAPGKVNRVTGIHQQLLSNPDTNTHCAIRQQDYSYWPLLEVLYLVNLKYAAGL